MIETINNAGRYAPVIKCDVCGKQITDAEMALALYPVNVEGGSVPTLHVHKGVCDRKASALQGDEGGTDELDTYLYYLMHNAGVSFDRAKSKADMLNLL